MPHRIRVTLVAMVVALVAAVGLPALPTAHAAPTGIFSRLPGFKPSGPTVRVTPRTYTAVGIEPQRVRTALAGAPAARSAQSTVLELPTPDGRTERFAVQRSTVMEAGLAAAHPELATWSGISTDHPGTSVAVDLTPMGFHASVRGPNGQNAWFVEPAYNRRGTTQHLVYYGRDLPATARSPLERELPVLKRSIDARRSQQPSPPRATVVQRTYRLALLNDPSYAAFFGTENVLAEKVTLVNRLNQVYNDDLAIRLVLVDGSDRLNLDTAAKATGPNGPCGSHACYTVDAESEDYVEGQLAYCDNGTLVRNQIVLGQLIGASNYDIGHIALGRNGGGIAGLGVVGAADKAAGCTGIPNPVGDAYAVDYVAHEMGHQFGGNHTFNGTQRACSGGNRNPATSVEPGSGTSVMAYAGICAQDNLQPHSDPYFSQRSLSEINAYTGTPASRVTEVQDVSLTGFDTPGDTITLDYPGAKADPVTLTFGSTYTAANLEAAVEKLTGKNVTIAKWGYDPYAGTYSDPVVYPAPVGTPDAAGFQVIFAGSPNPSSNDTDRAAMNALLVTASTGVSVHVGETAAGGPARNQGDTQRTGNRAPTVTAPARRTLPVRTPFTLTGAGRDRDGDQLTYLWEQNDVGGKLGTALVDNRKLDGPLFRVFSRYADVSAADTAQSPSPGENLAGTDPSRTFPDLTQILAGQTNARTGTCPAAPTAPAALPLATLNCYSEFLPVAGYVGNAGSTKPAMHFRLTARDSVPGGGGVSYADVTLPIDAKAGPFLVSSFATGGTLRSGSTTSLRWQVNGTRRLAADVAISVSTDEGATWQVLRRRTANDGSAQIRLPRRPASRAWIRVAAVDNYFFDVSDSPIRLR